MNTERILAEYDSMFGNKTLEEIEAYLYENICLAVRNQEDSAILTLLNEMIGLCRDTSQKEKALKYCEQLKKLLLCMNLEGTKEYATSLQNIANAYRAFGLWDKALDAFQTIEAIYQTSLAKDDYLWASLYNNWGILYQEMLMYENSVMLLRKALALIEKIPDGKIKVAITKTNLACSLFGLKTEETFREGHNYLKEALDVFIKDGERDFHYGAALVAMGDYHVHYHHLSKAKEYYQKGLAEVLIHTGRTEYYYRVKEKLEKVSKKCREANQWKSNLERSREFYEHYGSDMIHKQFPEYEDRIAVGLVGEGSDCFGFDDEISADHDYGPGFCMWLNKEDFLNIGGALQNSYDKLVKEVTGDSPPLRLRDRRGVFEADSFFSSEQEETKLAELVNGEIFRDDLGLVTAKRTELLTYYPEKQWRQNLANYLHEFSQYGQVNYARMMAREDYLTANLCIGKAIESAMDIAYVLCKAYAPYYKWKRKGLEHREGMKDIVLICEELSKVPCQKQAWEGKTYSSKELNTVDRCVVLTETLARVLLTEMRNRGLVQGTDVFLEQYLEQIVREIEQ